jgi:hypothetical protein
VKLKGAPKLMCFQVSPQVCIFVICCNLRNLHTWDEGGGVKNLRGFTIYIYIYYWKLNQNYSRIPCFVQNEIKRINKFCNISKHNLWFSTSKYLHLLLLFSQNYVSKNHPSFPHMFPLWTILSHIIMIQNQQEFIIQNYNVPWTVLVLNAMFI